MLEKKREEKKISKRTMRNKHVLEEGRGWVHAQRQQQRAGFPLRWPLRWPALSDSQGHRLQMHLALLSLEPVVVSQLTE
jgi:hypothetical protein